MAKTLQHQIIEGALHLIAEEAHWTRCSMARNSEGDPCSVWDPAAFRFCAVGALWRAAYELTDPLKLSNLLKPSLSKSSTSTAGATVCKRATMWKVTPRSWGCFRSRLRLRRT